MARRKGVTKVKITGFRKIQKDMDKLLQNDLPKKIGDLHLKDSIRQLKKGLKDPRRSTGNLARSLKVRTRKYNYTITSNMPYAAIQNYGGKIRITDKMRKKMFYLYKEFGLGVYLAIATTKKTHITIPAKNYLAMDPIAYRRMVNRQTQKLLNRI